jgi:cold shock protein
MRSLLDPDALAELIHELEDNVRAFALDVVRSVLDAELARLEAEFAASLPAAAPVRAAAPAPAAAPARVVASQPPPVPPPVAPEIDETLERGAVKWFSDDKGYGFIAGDTGHDVFVHRKALAASGLRTLRDGQRVQYAEEPGAKGPVATRVTTL